MDAIERTRMFRELVLIRSRLFTLDYRLIREGPIHLWRIEKSQNERHIWLEFEGGSWSLKPLGSKQRYSLIWLTIMEAIADANGQSGN